MHEGIDQVLVKVWPNFMERGIWVSRYVTKLEGVTLMFVGAWPAQSVAAHRRPGAVDAVVNTTPKGVAATNLDRYRVAGARPMTFSKGMLPTTVPVHPTPFV